MTLQVLVSTMNRSDVSLAEKMNINSDALIINQTQSPVDDMLVSHNGNNVKMLSFNEFGLSKSRNRAISNSDADICLIADDDIVYCDDYKDKIISAHEAYPQYDIIAFSFITTNPERQKFYYDKPVKMGYIKSMKIASFEISFRRSSVVNKNIKFNENFGAGSGKYSMGEENIFLYECLKKGLKILFIPVSLGTVTHEESTWFSGWNRKLFHDKGAMFFEMSHLFFLPLTLQFAVRKYPLYKNNLSFACALTEMVKGKKEYKKLLKR